MTGGHVTAGADDVNGGSALIAAQHGDSEGEVALVFAMLILRHHVQCYLLFFPACNGGKRFHDTPAVCRLQMVEEEAHRHILVYHLPLFVKPAYTLGGNMDYPDTYATGSQDVCQSLVATAYLVRHAAFYAAIGPDIEECHGNDEHHESHHLPNPFGNARVLVFRIEPFVLDGLQVARGLKHGVYAVYLVQQARVVGHELILAMRNIDGRELHVLEVHGLYQPFQRHCVPQNLVARLVVGTLYSFLHVIIGDGI